jgi:hypothetical protein
MNSFIGRVAAEFYKIYGQQISDFTFVFPNRRAGLFFQKYLSQVIQVPLFSPDIMTINDCFLSATNLKVADRLQQLFYLYEIFLSKTKSDETFDSFLFWGEMLLGDFNEIDKYLVDAQQLFTNLKDLKDIDGQFEFFSDTQIEAIKEFWASFSPAQKGLSSEKFESTWNVLFPIYDEFCKKLLSDGLANEGLICRSVVEELKTSNISSWDDKQFVFIGFNALNPCERKLFIELQKRGKADFYWDYEGFAVADSDNKASAYRAENQALFASRFEIPSVVSQFSDSKIELIGVPSSVGQAKKVFTILDGLFPNAVLSDEWMNTAVILPDETLLSALLNCIPTQIDKINITMGLPIQATPLISLLEHIFELHLRGRKSASGFSFYHQHVIGVINHQYVGLLYKDDVRNLANHINENNLIYVDSTLLHKNELFSLIFQLPDSSDSLIEYLTNILLLLQNKWHQQDETTSSLQLECDFMYQIYLTLNRLKDVMMQKPITITLKIETFIKLVKQLFNSISIPFVGEPLSGLQVMGVLEVRGLDFDNLIITSFNEGVFPKKSNSQSFIPANLRKGFGLPTTEQQDAITAYNFYRLIHRAKRVYFIYDSRTEGRQLGQISRFYNQLKYHYGIDIIQSSQSFDIAFNASVPIEIQKSDYVMQQLERFCDQGHGASALSASSINTYIDCPLQFYLSKVEKMDVADEIIETIESDTFGTLYHAVMEYLYEPFVGKMIEESAFDALLNNALLIEKMIKKAFVKIFLKKSNDVEIELEGNNLLISRVLKKYVVQSLKMDKFYAPFLYVQSEELCTIQFPINNGNKSVNIKGFIDRIDYKNDVFRILDYKTGKGSLEFVSIPQLFDFSNDKRPKFVLQTFLYGLLYKSKTTGKIISPGVFFMRNTFKSGFSTQLIHKISKDDYHIVENFADYEEEFSQHLTSCIESMFDKDIPFSQTPNLKVCLYCKFKEICNRHNAE